MIVWVRVAERGDEWRAWVLRDNDVQAVLSAPSASEAYAAAEDYCDARFLTVSRVEVPSQPVLA